MTEGSCTISPDTTARLCRRRVPNRRYGVRRICRINLWERRPRQSRVHSIQRGFERPVAGRGGPVLVLPDHCLPQPYRKAPATSLRGPFLFSTSCFFASTRAAGYGGGIMPRLRARCLFGNYGQSLESNRQFCYYSSHGKNNLENTYMRTVAHHDTPIAKQAVFWQDGLSASEFLSSVRHAPTQAVTAGWNSSKSSIRMRRTRTSTRHFGACVPASMKYRVRLKRNRFFDSSFRWKNTLTCFNAP